MTQTELYKVISEINFGDNRTRTDNFMLAKHTLYQLSYTPLYNNIPYTNPLKYLKSSIEV